MAALYRVEFENSNSQTCEVWCDPPGFGELYPDLLRKQECGEIGNVRIFGAAGERLANRILAQRPVKRVR